MISSVFEVRAFDLTRKLFDIFLPFFLGRNRIDDSSGWGGKGGCLPNSFGPRRLLGYKLMDFLPYAYDRYFFLPEISTTFLLPKKNVESPSRKEERTRKIYLLEFYSTL